MQMVAWCSVLTGLGAGGRPEGADEPTADANEDRALTPAEQRRVSGLCASWLRGLHYLLMLLLPAFYSAQPGHG